MKKVRILNRISNVLLGTAWGMVVPTIIVTLFWNDYAIVTIGIMIGCIVACIACEARARKLRKKFYEKRHYSKYFRNK